MRIAIFSDVHGNIYALDAVLNAISADGHFDTVIAAGDICLGGSDPAGCVDLLRGAGVLAVYGNTDEYIYAPEKKPGDKLHLRKWDRILQHVHWARSKMGDDRIEWLRALPLDLCFSSTSDPTGDLLVFHANPFTIEEMLYPLPEKQLALLGEIRQPDDDPELDYLLGGVTASVLAFGHFHYTSIREWRGLTLVNVAPCSMPFYDKDPRARYTIFEQDRKQWQITRRYVDYHYKQELRALQASGMPGWEEYARTFP